MSSFRTREMFACGCLIALWTAWPGFAPACAEASPQAAEAVAPDHSHRNIDPAAIFQAGQDALNGNRLDEAERDFHRVIEIDPGVGGAYANLGVVYMRRKQWANALKMLDRAETLMPQAAGIRLNIGLVYFRQNEFLKAIPFFEEVVRSQPAASQARHLLGLCYFFDSRWADAADTLEPLWPEESGHLSYLYVLSIAAHRAGRKELDEKATARLIQIGDGSPEFHLFMGKAHLNLEQYDLALADFQAAEQTDPKLPFVHFNLGLTYLKKQDYERARDEFVADAAIEPDLPFNYEELGEVFTLMQQDRLAEKNYRAALERDPLLVNSYVGLAKLYQHGQRYSEALTAIDSAGKLDPERTDIHYLRGQILIHLGRKSLGKQEIETSARLENQRRAERQKQVETGTVPSPELLQDEP